MNPQPTSNPGAEIGGVIGMLCVLVPIAVVVLYTLFYPAVQAYRRGYNPFVWGLVVILAQNPIFLFVLLGMLPNRARMKLRDEYAAELDDKLAEAGIVPTVAVGLPVRDTSIGDAMTEMPRDRCIGDDATRL